MQWWNGRKHGVHCMQQDWRCLWDSCFSISPVCVTVLGAMKHRLRKLTALICKMSGYHSQVTRSAGLRQLQAPASPAVPGFHPQQISPWLAKTSLPFIGPELSHLPAINHSQERRLGLLWSDLIDLTYLWSKTLSEKKRERERKRDWELSNLSITPERTSVQFSSVTQSCPTLCNPRYRSMPGLPVHH